MNKILFKLIEGNGKFFLMRSVPKEPGYCVDALIACDHGCQCDVLNEEYKKIYLKHCIDEALKNGEIVNPEVLPNVWESINKGGKFCFLSTFKELKDGDTFNLPDGLGFEEIGLDATGNSNCGEEFVERSAIRLLPEKPVQKR